MWCKAFCIFTLLVLGLAGLSVSVADPAGVTISTTTPKPTPTPHQRHVPAPFTRTKVIDEDYTVQWEVSPGVAGNSTFGQRITFTVTARTLGYIGFGISNSGGKMAGSDIVIAGGYPNGVGYIQDRFGEGTFTPSMDESQDYILHSATENETHTVVTFSRLLDTCDERDVVINGATQRIIWALGERDTLSYHRGGKRGSVAVNFLDPQIPAPRDLSAYKTWRTSVNMTLPSNDTVYWCNFFRGPNVTSKHHVIGFDIYVNEATDAPKHTHHADLYKCTVPPGEAPDYFEQFIGDGYECYFSTEYMPAEHCQLFELQWSIGGDATFFPDYVGLPIGESSSTEYYMTEIHFDNPDKLDNLYVDAGIEVYYTDELREHDAGFLQVGSMTSKAYSMTVPPMSTNFVVSTHCESECTRHMPQEGVNVFVYLLHSHLNGRQMRIRHFRNGTELPWMANDEHYDFNFQNNRMLPREVKLMPDDHLTLECTYDNKWKNGRSTLGGRSPREEMCQTFFMYYPRTLSLNQCGSYYPQRAMLKFMGIENATLARGEFDPIVTAPSSLAGLRYSDVIENRVKWTDERREIFQNLVRYGAHESYCFPATETIGVASYPPVSQEYTRAPMATCSVGA